MAVTTNSLWSRLTVRCCSGQGGNIPSQSCLQGRLDFAGQRDSGLLLSLQSWTGPGRRDMGDCRNHVPSRPSLTCVLPFALLVISLLVSITAEIQACL